MAVKQKILIVDDDNNIAELISLYLTKECYDTRIVNDGEEALKAFASFAPNLILLDLMLPGLSGEEILPLIKGIPVIVVSAKAEVSDKVELLLNGACDYITKPFDTAELLARLTVQLRMAESAPASVSVLCFRTIRLDTASHSVTVADTPVRLTQTEYAILKLLMQNPSQVITKTLILERISEDTPDCTESSLKVHISNLRKKLKAVDGNDYIEAVWGIGFKLNEEIS